MKIIQVIPNFSLAGAEVMCENLTYELVNKGHEVIVVSLYSLHTPITDRLENAGVDIRYLDKESGFDLSCYRKIYKLLKDENPDVVHTHLYSILYAMPMAIIAGIKCKIHTVHNVAEKETFKIARKVNKILYKCFGVVPVALSNLIQSTIVDEYKIKKTKVPVVLNGMPLYNFERKSDYSLGETVNIIHVGRFQEQKNHLGLISAFEIVHKKHNNAVLNLYGEGPLFDDIKTLVKEKGLENSVIFHGTSPDIKSKLLENDIFCLPSNYEGIPITLIEAMASAMPIVATNVGGVGDMLTDGNDAFVCENDVEKISDSLCCLIESEELRTKFGQNALLRAQNFSSQKMAQEYLKIYIN